MKSTFGYLVGLALFLTLSPAAQASYITDIGYDSLKAQLGSSTPTGVGIRVTQVEAPESNSSSGQPIFMPNPSHPEFAGKTITPVGGNPTGLFSGHATEVGRLLYGTNSIAYGMTQVASYEANSWLNSLTTASGTASASLDRVANHSWIGGSGTNAGVLGNALRSVDLQVTLNEYIQVAAMSNGPSDSPLLGGSAYNVISVGRTDGAHQQGSVAVSGDSQYGVTGRTAPTLVVPQGVTSTATPVVAAAAAILVQTGHEGGLTLSEGSRIVEGVGTIYNAEQSETVKAALMAGADRQTANTTPGGGDITDYRSAGHETVNGLDSRYGAGQLNIYNSYRILAGGEQRSAQNAGGDIRSTGFDYGSIGGPNGTGHTASYFFNTTGSELSLFASLVWNLDVANTSIFNAVPPATKLYNLDLSLFDVTNNRLVATSASLIDNTENLYFKLLLGHRYEMRVTTNESTPWDYALAWRIDANAAPVPIPPTAWLFVTGALGLLLATRAMKVRHP